MGHSMAELELQPQLQDFPEVRVDTYAGFPVLRIHTPHARAIVSLHGGQLISYVPAGGEELFWLSPTLKPAPQAIRGGVPVCWPYFGRQDQPAHVPQHGFARNTPWTLTGLHRGDDGAIALTLALPAHPDTPLRLTQALHVGGSLRQSLITRNTGNVMQRFTCALHSYLSVSDARQVRIRGLEGLRYVDKFDGAVHVQEGQWDLHDPRDPGRCDRLYADTGTRFELIDAGADRSISLTTSGSRSLVAWNPGALGAAAMDDVGVAQWSRFVCLEAANAGEDTVALEPGQEHVLGQALRVSTRESDSATKPFG